MTKDFKKRKIFVNLRLKQKIFWLPGDMNFIIRQIMVKKRSEI